MIDEEEFTAYQYPTDPSAWEILLDPTGMAQRTLSANKFPREAYDHVMRQIYEKYGGRPSTPSRN